MRQPLLTTPKGSCEDNSSNLKKADSGSKWTGETKCSYETCDAAEAAGMTIKKDTPSWRSRCTTGLRANSSFLSCRNEQ
jgi:hypothetical protein